MAYGVGKRPNERRLELMAKVDADVWVLTETHDSLSLTQSGYRPIHGEQRPVGDGQHRNIMAGSRWVSIWSRLPISRIELAPGDPRRHCCIRRDPLEAMLDSCAGPGWTRLPG